VPVRVVTDSACDLPQELIDELQIEVVPLTIRFGSEELVDREQLSTAEFWSRLRSSTVLPETAAPSAGSFEERFRKLIEGGATGIVCINLSSRLSATMQAAQLAAASVEASCPVEVVDSLTCSMGLGALCLTAARRAADGGTLEKIVDEVLDRRETQRAALAMATLFFVGLLLFAVNSAATSTAMRRPLWPLSGQPVPKLVEARMGPGGRSPTSGRSCCEPGKPTRASADACSRTRRTSSSRRPSRCTCCSRRERARRSEASRP